MGRKKGKNPKLTKWATIRVTYSTWLLLQKRKERTRLSISWFADAAIVEKLNTESNAQS
jgi:hypothetical protein